MSRHVTVDTVNGRFADIGISDAGYILWFELDKKNVYNAFLAKGNSPQWRELLGEIIDENGLGEFGLMDFSGKVLQ